MSFEEPACTMGLAAPFNPSTQIHSSSPLPPHPTDLAHYEVQAPCRHGLATALIAAHRSVRSIRNRHWRCRCCRRHIDAAARGLGLLGLRVAPGLLSAEAVKRAVLRLQQALQLQHTKGGRGDKHRSNPKHFRPFVRPWANRGQQAVRQARTYLPAIAEQASSLCQVQQC